jgi:ATP-dependent helicase/nuclease subunit B
VTRLFAPQAGPRVFALPPGIDFIAAIAAGLDARLAGHPPEAAADVTILLNTRRAARALEARLAEGPARILPRIGTLADIAADPALALADLPPPASPLRRQFELARLVRSLLRRTGRAPESSAFALAESLAALLDEMGGAGIPAARLAEVDAGDHAEHWREALAFLEIAAAHLAESGAVAGETRRRAAVAALARRWAAVAPRGAFIIAGSTGSRPATRALMALVARLDQGAVILPGVDPDLPRPVWERLGTDAPGAADHPQHGFRVLAEALGIDPAALPVWQAGRPAAPERRRLIALAMRPAPVTDQWREEAPDLLPELAAATGRMTWLEAPGPREEANAIALILREAAEAGLSAALVTPDRSLARRVSACLARWRIIPDDSAGRPLGLTPPGILLSLVAAIPPGGIGSTDFLAILKHPLTASAMEERGRHLRLVRDCERGPLAGHPPVLDWARLTAWAEAERPEALPWLDWLCRALVPPDPGPVPLAARLAWHRAAVEALAAGPAGSGAHRLWEKAAGEAARSLLDEIAAAADAADPVTPEDYRALLATLFARINVPEEAVLTRKGIAIWGTLEARSQWADRVILAGLNEGIWPGPPPPDPWLSRPLRRALGLPAPETLIGLAAHDFALAAAAPEIVLSRATRDAEAPTVASRWLLRLENLLRGLGEPGEAALAAMRARGRSWLDLADRLDRPCHPVPPAPRPAPAPPRAARPRSLPVTAIETLIRDPFAIYARHVLGLDRLDPPGREAEARDRGTALHEILDLFVARTAEALPVDAEDILCAIARDVLARAAPWPATRVLWMARIARIAPWFVRGEAERRAQARPFRREVRGRLVLADPPLALTARADRIDRMADGRYALYDYKSGALPSERQARAFAIQLHLEAMMIASGAFRDVPAGPVALIELIGFRGGETLLLNPAEAPATFERLVRLLKQYQDEGMGYAARLRPQRITFAGDYDHLARFGEWNDGDPPETEPVG